MTRSAPDASSPGQPPLLELRDAHKVYGATRALDGAALRLRAGTVTGLIGENGAGKSTLVKTLSGLVQIDSGQLLIDGVPLSIGSVPEARAAGICTVFQELSFIPDLSVAENLILSTVAPGAPWPRARRAREARAAELAARWGLHDLPVSSPIASLSLRDRQLVEILGAVVREPRVLILDEPTSSLLPEDTAWLHGVLRRLSAGGCATLFISHMLDEVEAFCDSVTVQRNGRHIATVPIAEFSRPAAIEQMIGRSFGAAYPPKTPAAADAAPLLETRDLRAAHGLTSATLTLGEGEIVGVAGLEGQGQRELFEVLAGALRKTGGSIVFAGEPRRIHSPRAALRLGKRRGGIAFVPPERKTQGLVLDLSVRKNTALTVLSRVSRAGFISRRRESALVEKTLRAVDVNLDRLDTPVRALSGGNQQKVVFARAIVTDPRVLLLYDPTRGVDIGTKFELYALIQQVAAAGTGVLMYSTEIPELVNICHRVLVMYNGEIVAELRGDAITESALMGAALGSPTERESA
ncbi:sugar ABC transporter ATP-binding protein [Mycetocola spongiae]|uniref:sugar ABC transporter ATP-binding protein n=1 Tax=Mycetocola spongiae TaxID=2859226 RepID=UPI001CF5710E|nr:sugar ABC transporter ATP-binding protein [Mycetocola spongiae]UCR88188.1 sugar ABC transporter ATP-binding protein [Mycetocola spongiae]